MRARWILCTALALSLTGRTAAGTAAAPPSAGPPSAGTSAPPLPAGTNTADVVAQLEPGVVTVNIPGALGSGVVYRSDVVITNQHVADIAGIVSGTSFAPHPIAGVEDVAGALRDVKPDQQVPVTV